LTVRQQEFFDAIVSLTAARGFAPSIKEVSAAVGVNTSRGHSLMGILVWKGKLRREARIPRSLQVVREPSAEPDAPPAKARGQRKAGATVG